MNTTSTRSSFANADVLSQHDANVQKRFRRALLCSLVFNVVALGAFAVSKSAPSARVDNAATPMQMTISTTHVTLPESRVAISSTRSADNLSNERIARAGFRSAPRREKSPRQSSRAKNTSTQIRRNTKSRNENRAPRRVAMRTQNRETPSFPQNSFSPRAQNTTVSETTENRYPLEHREHPQRDVSSSTSRTRVGDENTTASKTARTWSLKNGSVLARSQDAGSAKGASIPNGSSSGNGATSEQSNASSLGAPLQNARDESNRESSTRARRNESAEPEKPRVEKPRVESETPGKVEVERAPVVPPIERKSEERKIVRRREVREAEVVSQAKVKVPRRLRRDKRKTSVRIEFDVDERGEAKARVSESSGDKDLDEVVLKAARKTRFKPRTEDGVATKTTKKMRYDINIDDGDKSSDNDDDE